MLPHDEPVQVVIVGAGAAGSLYAARLAAGGKQVRVLEAGPAWQLGDLYSSQIWARRLKWGGAPVEVSGEDRIPHNSQTGWGFGGAALHHYGTWPRFSEETFELYSRYGVGMDWPMSYDDLRPHYDRVQAEVGISGDAGAEIWRPPGEPYPMPPLKTFRHGEMLKQGFDALGMHTAPLPVAINSTTYNGRPPCIYDGWCDAGCPTGALGNPLVTYFKKAQELGVQFSSNAQVTRVKMGRKGYATGVEYVKDGQTRIQPADWVILAGSVFQNPRLLLNSFCADHPDGLANQNGLVGRFLLAEGAAVVYGLFKEETECHMGVNAGQYTHREPYALASRPEVFGGLQWQIGGAVKPNDLYGIAMSRSELYGHALNEFIIRASKHFAFMIGFCGGTPLIENRITLADERDKNDMPLARVLHTTPPAIKSMRDYMQKQGLEVVQAAGALELWAGPAISGHQVGGTIMGNDPAKSVTNGYGICHDIPNVMVAGAGLFPSCTGASPTFSLMALASRSADFLLQNG